MSKFKVGDKVRVREDLDSNGSYNMEDSNWSDGVSNKMLTFCGVGVTICKVDECGYELKEDFDNFNWTDEMFEDMVIGFDDGLVEYKIDINIGSKPLLAIKPRNEFMRERAKELALVIYENLDAGDNVKQEWLDELWQLDEYIVEEE